MRRLRLLLAALCIFPISTVGLVANAADNQGTVTGIVKDALGRPIEEATLTVQGPSGSVLAHATSDQRGKFEFHNLANGTYAIEAKKLAFKTAVSIVSVTPKGVKPIEIAMQSETSLSLPVVAQRLDRARNGLSPITGGSVYTFSERAIQQLPQGNNTPLNQVLLQAPGVVQDSFGAVHVRGDHGNLQYRLNGILLPEGVNGFGQILTPASRVRSIS